MFARFSVTLVCVVLLTGCTLKPAEEDNSSNAAAGNSADSARIKKPNKKQNESEKKPNESEEFVNLITDPSLENTMVGELPNQWSRYIDTDKAYEYRVVEGGRASTKSLMIAGQGTRVHAFANGVPLDRTKRYVLRGWVRYEGDADGAATIKFNYRDNGGNNYHIDDGDQISIGRAGWQFLTKTDRAAEVPKATMLWVSCKLEGNGKAFFDDLELIAYDRDKLSADFDEKHGKHNHPTGGLDMLSRFVGTWNLSTTAKPAKWLPDGGTFTGQESTVWALKNRVILIRDMSQPDGKKGLWIVTYDPRQNAYPLWGFDSKGLMGAQWRLTWDKATSTASGIGTDMPDNWTSGGKNHFPDADTNLVTAWIKDENGELLLDHEGRKARQPDEHEAAIVAAWKKHEPAADLPAELKVLDRMIGAWNLVQIQKPAAWTPDGSRTTAKIKRQWILDGRFVMETAIVSDGRENLSLFGFDPQNKVYRNWWFSSDGNRNTPTGSWDEQSQTMSLVTDLDDGIKIRSSGRFADPNQEVWEFKATDAAGKVYLDMEIMATRHAAAGGNVPKANDQSRLQGTWGAVAYLQDGQGGDEPIAPEDAAIKYIFKGDQFTLLASGNAGETPKGSFKLGSRGKARTIDLIFPPDSNGTKGQTMSGVYELDGDTLKVTYSSQGAIVFKRIKK